MAVMDVRALFTSSSTQCLSFATTRETRCLTSACNPTVEHWFTYTSSLHPKSQRAVAIAEKRTCLPKNFQASQLSVRRRRRGMHILNGMADAVTDYGGATVADSDPLFTPFQLGPFQLKHRIALAPLTRCRAEDHVPNPAAIEYYTQRSTDGGFMISEGTVINETGHGYPQTPGIYTDEQVEAWKPIVDSVHAKGAIFFCQIWHVGRVSHPHYQPNGGLPVGPSEKGIPASAGGQVWLGGNKMADYVEKVHALTREEIKAVVHDFATAARNAIRAGFDGVEIHGAHAYLIDEFLKESSNERTDEYGGSLENRCRFALEVVDAVIAEVGADRTGIRLSPFSTFCATIANNPVELGVYMAKQLSSRGIAYLHCVEPRMNGQTLVETSHALDPIRNAFKGPLIAAGGYEGDTARAAVTSGHADIIAFGRKFLANPDFPKRLLTNAPLNDYDRSTFYSPDQVVGYTDYPFLDESLAKAAA